MTKVKTHKRRRGSKRRVGAGMFDSITNHPLFQKTQNAFNNGVSSISGLGQKTYSMGQGAATNAYGMGQTAYNRGSTSLGNAWSQRPKLSMPSMNTNNITSGFSSLAPTFSRGGQPTYDTGYNDNQQIEQSSSFDPNQQFYNMQQPTTSFGGRKSKRRGRKGRKGTRRH